MNIVKIGWSGGKDSTCAVMKHIERGDKVKIVHYTPMFTKEIPLILKDHYSFIKQTASYFESLGAEIYWADKGLTYYEYVTHIATRGKCRGKMFGFPIVGAGMCGFKRDGKVKALSLCDVGEYDYESVGICFDELKRQNQLTDSLRSVLCELGITQNDTRQYCLENGLYSPHYTYNTRRDGCALCYNAKKEERERWFADSPEAVPIVIDLQNLVKRERPERPPLRGYKYFIEGGEG